MSQRVVTLPPQTVPALPWARLAVARGAHLIEIRDDLHPVLPADLDAVQAEVPVLFARRTAAPLPAEAHRARLVDEPLGQHTPASNLWSHHAAQPLAPQDALALWKRAAPPAHVSLKHVEPMGPVDTASRLLQTQALLTAHFGPGRVTVLCTGDLALPFRAVLSVGNALDYCALDASFAAAPGQRLLADAVRAARGGHATSARLGILGNRIGASRSPRIHPAPFDRLDLPPDTPLPGLLSALHPHYRGFAVTSPFKKDAARAVGASEEAVNTLVRTRSGWKGHNTDVAGAVAMVIRAQMSHVVALGDGGVTAALRQVRRIKLVVHAHAQLTHGVLRGDVVWTWPPHVAPPPGLRLDGARVAVLAYGAPGRVVAARVRALGGTPLMMGACWFVAQAREQQRLWREAV